MQGSWNIEVKSKSAAFKQRFIINGSDSADGIYEGKVGTPTIFVTGAQWSITVEHNPKGPTPWTPSADRLGTPYHSGGKIKFNIFTNDTGLDQDYNDLVLTCWISENDSEFVLYGKVSTYKGFCGFNPCYPYPYLVVDSMANLKELLKNATVREVLEKLYPERIREAERPPLIKVPFPEPDPAPFRPLMIPLSAEGTLAQVEHGRLMERADLRKTKSSFAVRSGKLSLTEQPVEAPMAARLSVYDDISIHKLELAKLKDRFRLACTVKSRPGILLRFLEYDRTTVELTGGSYSGTGDRQILGLTVTDEQGNYIFRFTRTLLEIAEEYVDVASGESLATELRPDIIIQVVSEVDPGTPVLYETGLYSNVTNLRRINLCIPEDAINPGPAACQGGRAIQAIGNIFTLSGVGNTLDTEGRITATHSSGPQITRGAWAGRLDLNACFLDHPEVTHYTVRYRKPGEEWSFVNQLYKHIYIPEIGNPSSPLHKVGPFDTSLKLDGGLAQIVDAYKNIENNSDWVATHRIRKIQLSSAIYASALYMNATGTVEFWIEGYNVAGNKVAAADDKIKLFIDNRKISGDIASISMGGLSLGECGLFDLPAENQPLVVRFKVDHPGGFLKKYYLQVLRGSATSVPVTAPLQPLSMDYDETTHGSFFYGTLNAVSPDGDGYVEAELYPVGAWLPFGKNFCAFAFEIYGKPRVTDGHNLATGYRLDVELIGISYNPPAP